MVKQLLKPTVFQRHILDWFDQHGRKTLPWQQNKTPYRVWISEIMLQQTQVNTVVPYFQRFIERFPNIRLLAAASEDDVLHIWAGLGYYSRARNLHLTAKMIVESFHGEFPGQLDALQKLPGIGRSTAGAILAIAFQKKAVILDGNVKRVLMRFHGIQDAPSEKKVIELLWQLAEQYTPDERVADYTQAIMDMGATLCVRGTPRCDKCPLSSCCIANLHGLTLLIPAKKSTATLPTRQTTMLVMIKNGNAVFLEKRPPVGVWGGLWSLPEVQGILSAEDAAQIALQYCPGKIESVHFSPGFRHTFSHFHLDIFPVFITISETKGKMLEAAQQHWYSLTTPVAIGLPAPIKALLTRIMK